MMLKTTLPHPDSNPKYKVVTVLNNSTQSIFYPYEWNYGVNRPQNEYGFFCYLTFADAQHFLHILSTLHYCDTLEIIKLLPTQKNLTVLIRPLLSGYLTLGPDVPVASITECVWDGDFITKGE